MQHDFSEKLDRRGTDCFKWDANNGTLPYPMGIADADFRVPQPVVTALQEKIAEGALGYGVGTDSFYKAMSAYYARQYNLHIDPSCIRFSPGLLVAMKLLCESCTGPNDAILIQPPVYHRFRTSIEATGRKLVENPLIYNEESRTYSVDFEDLDIKTKDPNVTMMMLCSPANPTCKVFTLEELTKIFEICHRNGVLVVSDEVHSDLYYHNVKHIPFLSLSKEAFENSIIISSNCKTFNLNNFYTSYILIPNAKHRALYDAAYDKDHLNYNQLGCLATEITYNGSCDYYIEGLLAYLQKNIDYLTKFLEENDIELSFAKPEATFLMWLDFRKWGLNCEELSALLEKHGVGLFKGTVYGTGGEGFMRMNIACHIDTLVGALDAIRDAYKMKGNAFGA